MAKTITMISDKLTKVNESFTVNMYDNGYMFQISGRDSEDEYKTANIVCNSLADLVTLVKEASEMERND